MVSGMANWRYMAGDGLCEDLARSYLATNFAYSMIYPNYLFFFFCCNIMDVSELLEFISPPV